MQRLASKVQPAPAGTRALVGQASIHRVQDPQRSGGGESGSSSSDVINSPRKNHDPKGSLIRQVLRPIHPSPASRAKLRSNSGAVSTQIFDSNGSNSRNRRTISS